MALAEAGLDRGSVSSIRDRKTFNQNRSPIISLEFSHDGERLITTSENDYITLYDVNNASMIKALHSETYGCGHIAWGPHPDTLLVSSTKKEHAVRYMSLYDHKYLRVFTGHTDKITNIAMSPLRDQILTSSDDKTVRLWDIRVNACTHKLETGSATAVGTIDHEGLVVGVGTDSTHIRLFDFRQMQTGPFNTFTINEQRPSNTWTKMKFSPTGNMLLLNTDSPNFVILDAFNCNYIHHRRSAPPLKPGQAEIKGNFYSDFSSDEHFIFAGGPNGIVHVFDPANAAKVTELKSKHLGNVTHTIFNPVMKCMATATNEVHLWA